MSQFQNKARSTRRNFAIGVLCVCLGTPSLVSAQARAPAEPEARVRYLLELHPDAGLSDAEALERAVAVLRKRLDALALAQPSALPHHLKRWLDAGGRWKLSAEPAGESRIALEGPASVLGPDQVKELLRPGKLGFHVVPPEDGGASGDVESFRFDPAVDPSRAGEALTVYRRAELVSEHIAEAKLIFDSSGRPSVMLRFTPDGARIFERLSSNVGQRVAIVVDERILSAPVFREPIRGGVVALSGSFTVETAEALAMMLSSGVLPGVFEILEHNIVHRE